LVQFEDLLSSLEKSIKDIIKDVESKKKVLSGMNCVDVQTEYCQDRMLLLDLARKGGRGGGGGKGEVEFREYW